jgi:hypothetical protein
LQSMTGPLLLLRETFKTGVYLREKLCAQWHHWKTVQGVFHEHQEEAQRHHRLQDTTTTDSASFEQQSESLWLQDLGLLHQAVESHHELQPIMLSEILPPGCPRSPHSPSAVMLPPALSRLSTADDSIRPTSPRVQDVTEDLMVDPTLAGLVPSPSLSPTSMPPPGPLPERILLSSSNLKIRPSCDFRCPIKIPRHRSRTELPYTLSWDFTLLSLTGQDTLSPSSASSGSSIDIGFCVLGKTSDGFFPLLTPYQSVPSTRSLS